MSDYGHEQIVFFQNDEVGLKAIVAIHNTVLGPALGGTRMWNYASEEDALKDVLRLSRGMTYKAAAAGLSLGGGKAVIIGDPQKDKSQALFKMYGRCMNSLGGRYITAEDVNTSVDDMEAVFSETDYVVGIDKSHGGSGDPSPFTALGTYHGIRACLKRALNKDSFNGVSVAIQGAGSVGGKMAKILSKEGAKVFISDIFEDKIEKVKEECPNVEVVPSGDIVTMDCDVFSPCALGAIINDKTVENLKCKIVAGAANNQLDRLEHGDVLKKRKILYAPDYVINAGGLINVSLELEGYSPDRAERLTRNIYESLMNVFDISEKENISTAKSADHMVEKRLKQMVETNKMFSKDRKSLLQRIHTRR
ncbi:leucine dehydrogenase [bacterium]|nr:leucine dehydrogenase [bacterium]